MKKALAFIAVAAIAATTQAATVEWKSGVITTPDGQANANTRVVTASLFLIDATTYAGLDLSSSETQQKVLTDYLGTSADATGTSNKSGYANPKTTLNATGVDNSQYALIIYSYGTGDSAVYKVGKGTDYINSLGKQDGTNSSELATQTSWFSKSSSQPVPEPTTVALLALGLAAVGLKRKVA